MFGIVKARTVRPDHLTTLEEIDSAAGELPYWFIDLHGPIAHRIEFRSQTFRHLIDVVRRPHGADQHRRCRGDPKHVIICDSPLVVRLSVAR